MKTASLLPFCVLLICTMSAASRDDHILSLEATLRGFQEVPPVASPGAGTFLATISPDHTTISYSLRFNGLNAPAVMSHLHFGFPREAGGIMVWLCGPISSPARQTCPNATSGTIEGTLTAADVVGPVVQGIQPGQWDRVLRVIQAGGAYCNIHTTQSPAGEIHGQVKMLDDGDRDGH